MNELIKSINNKLNSIDFNKVYKGFKPYKFALYDQKKVYFLNSEINWDDRFMGNTAIQYEGEFIAIWNLAYNIEDIDVFTSKIAHEMFHVHQFTCGETRFPDEIKALNYTYNNENISMKYDETLELLNGNIEAFTNKRNYRSTLYQKEVEYETRIEQAEGLARYVELQVLKQLNAVEYNKEISRTKEIVNDINNYLPIRTLSYEIGCLLFQEIHKQNIYYSKSLTEKKCIYEQINTKKDIKPYKHNEYNTSFIDDYYKQLSSTIKRIKKESSNIIEFTQLTGLDPMNTFAHKNDIYYKYFVRVELPNKEMKMILKEAVSTNKKQQNNLILYY